MCGRYNNHLPKMIGWADALKDWPSVTPSYNVAPTSQVAVFRSSEGEPMRWGMIPSWSKAFQSSFATFNARVETVDSKPTFRSAWKRQQRCLIPMAGYYEWTGQKGSKQPFYITDREAGGLVVAGLFEPWGQDNQLSCTVLTKPANDELAPLHPRMPIILNPEDGQRWLDQSRGFTQKNLMDLSTPNTVFHPVSASVGNIKNNDEELIRPIDL